MAEHPDPAFSSHPLLQVQERARLERIKDNMHRQIERVLHRGRVGAGERVLAGGESAFDVLQEALLALLSTEPGKATTSWEALAVGIAQNKAKDAVRRSTRQRRASHAEPGTPDDVTVVSLDARADVASSYAGDDPEMAFVLAEQHRWLIRHAREALTERERLIFWTGYYNTQTDKALGAELGISGQAVGQQRRRIFRSLYDAARRDPSFPTLDASDEGE